MGDQKFDRIKRLSREGVWIVLGQLASVAGALMLVQVLTARLDPEQYGQLSLGLTVAVLVNQLVMGGLSNAIGRFYAIAAEKQDLHSYLSASRLLMVYATLVVVFIGLLLTAGLAWFGYPQWIGMAASALVFSVLTGYNSSLSGIQNAARQRAIVAFHSGLEAWLKIVLALGVLLWLGSTSTAVVIGYALSSLLITSSQFFLLRRLISDPITHINNRDQWSRQMWCYSWPFSAWGLFTWLQQVSDRWALAAFATTADVGLYAVLFQLGLTPITMATGMVMSFLGPILYARSGDASNQSRNAGVHQLAWRVTFSCLLLTLIGFLLTLDLHELIFRLLVATQFQSASYLLPWMVLAGGLFAAGQMLALEMMSNMSTASMSKAKIVTALLGLLFNICGASVAGLEGVVGAQLGFSVIYLIWMTLLSSGTSINFKLF